MGRARGRAATNRTRARSPRQRSGHAYSASSGLTTGHAFSRSAAATALLERMLARSMSTWVGCGSGAMSAHVRRQRERRTDLAGLPGMRHAPRGELGSFGPPTVICGRERLGAPAANWSVVVLPSAARRDARSRVVAIAAAARGRQPVMHCPGYLGRNCYRAADGGPWCSMCMCAFDCLSSRRFNKFVAPLEHNFACNLTGWSFLYGG